MVVANGIASYGDASGSLPKLISQEGYLHQQVCDYLKLQYPKIMFRTDFAAGIKMTIWQAGRHKRLQSGRAWPDLFIAESRKGSAGLFIELKAKTIYKRDGSLLANDHVAEQAEVLRALRDRNFEAVFAVGFDSARQIIDEYLN